MSSEPTATAILLVEDDGPTRHAVATFLRGHHHDVAEAADAATARTEWQRRRPDLIVLDLGLPDEDGLTIIREVRREAATPILVLSARDREADKVAALDLGADDYVTKPFGMAELRARIDALLRRAAGPAADGDRRDPCQDPDDGRHPPVRARQRHAGPPDAAGIRGPQGPPATHAGRLVTHGRLLRAVWGTAYSSEAHYVHVYVSQIRRKIDAADPDGSLHDLIVAEPGVGYRIAARLTVPELERFLSAPTVIRRLASLGARAHVEDVNGSDTASQEVQRVIDAEVDLVTSAINLVASGGASSTTVAGMRMTAAVIKILGPLAIERGVTLEPLWGSDESSNDIRVRRVVPS